MRSFDVAVVGTGSVARVHAESIAALGGRARITAAVEVDPDRGRDFADRFGIARLYPSLDELLDAETPDIVDLCTPVGVHAEHAIQCLQRDVTVVCEKPPALSLAELDHIAEHERSSRAHFATIFQHRFGGAAIGLAGLVARGSLGAPTTAVCHTLWYRGDEYFAAPWRGRWETEGGGPTMGHGIHQMDMMLAILGPWREVVAVAARRARPIATEDLSCAIVTLENGAIATVVNSIVSPRQTSYLRFDFADATVELEHLYGYGDDNWTATGIPGHEDRVNALWTQQRTGVPSGHAAQFAHVLRALSEGTAPPVTTADVRSTMELVAAIYASAFTGRPVRRGEVGPGSPFYERMSGVGSPWGPATQHRLPSR